MLRRLFFWLLQRLASLDPDLQAELTAYRERRAKLAAQVKEELEAISGLDDELTQLNSQRAANKTELAEAEREADRIEEEREGVLNEKPDSHISTAHDALRDRL